MNKEILIDALTDTIYNLRKRIEDYKHLVATQNNIIRTLTKLKEQSENEVARLKRLSEEQSKVINEFRNGF